MILLAGEQRLGFQVGNVNIRGAKLTLELFQKVFPLLWIPFFLCEVDVGFKVAAHGGELFVRGNLFFGALALAQYSLSGLLVIPEMGVGDAGFQRLQTLAIAGRVKDSSVQACCAVSVIRSDLAGLRGSLVSFYLILVIA